MLAALLLLAACASCTHIPLVQHLTPARDPLVIPTNDGPVKGYYSIGALPYSRAFVGIPFADPPVRFSPPVPLSTPWGGIHPNGTVYGRPRLATTYSKVCPQFGLELTSEDCLYLNVYVPPVERMPKHGQLPVMFWIYGGAYMVGSGNEYSLYDGKYLVEHTDVIVVTHNYRLGAFGFMTLQNEQGANVAGNVGILDQRMALQWVHANIHHFGGDPNDITIIGESAGALSVAIHLTSESTAPRSFTKAIMESPPFGLYMRTLDESTQVGKWFAKNLSCFDSLANTPDIACLRSKSIADILFAEKSVQPTGEYNFRPLSDVFWWWPHVDGKVVKENPMDRLLQGEHIQVPTIIGTMRDETGLFSLIYDIPLLSRLLGLRKMFQKDGYIENIQRIFGDKADTVLEHYPVHDDEQANELEYIRLTSDYLFTCPTIAVANALSAKQAPVHAYEFTHVSEYVPFLGKCSRNLACHGMDLPYLFRPALVPLSRKDSVVSHTKIHYWTAFMTNCLNHNVTQYPVWFAYEAKHQYYLDLSVNVSMKQHLKKERCALWNGVLGYHW